MPIINALPIFIFRPNACCAGSQTWRVLSESPELLVINAHTLQLLNVFSYSLVYENQYIRLSFMSFVRRKANPLHS